MLLCYVEWIMHKVFLVVYFGHFNQTTQAKLPTQVLERSMDLYGCTMALIHLNWAKCVSSNELFNRV